MSGISVLILTITNIFLTVRLLHSNNCSIPASSSLLPSLSFSSSSSSPYANSNNNHQINEISKQEQLIPEAPKIALSSKLCINDLLEIQRQQQLQQQQQQDLSNQNNNLNIDDTSLLLSASLLSTLGINKNYYHHHQYSTNNDDNTNILLKLQKINFNYGRWDNQHLFKFYDFLIIGKKFNELSKKYTVCLATQSSIEKLYSIVQVSQNWNGPISLSIYTAGDDEFIIFQLYFNYLYNCYSTIRENLLIHLTVPKNFIPKFYQFLFNRKHLNENLKFINFLNINQNLYLNCNISSDLILKRLLKLRKIENIKWRQKNPYPQNHQRNLARKGCQTSYVFLTDVDIIPSYNFTQNIDKFLRNKTLHQCKGNNIMNFNSNNNGNSGTIFNRLIGAANYNKNKNNQGNNNNGLCAFVVPTYEIDFRAKFPSNKTDLLRLVKKGLARPFHEKVFVYNQYATNFSRYVCNSVYIYKKYHNGKINYL